MNKLTALAGVAALGLGVQSGAWAYSATASVTVNFGGHTIAGANIDTGWTSNGVNTIASIANSTYFTTLGGYNSQSQYNQDFATGAQCAAIVGGIAGATPTATRKYGCRYTDVLSTPLFVGTPVVDEGPSAGSASGTLTVTDTTMTGTLTLLTTTDEATGGTSVLISGVNVGTGLAGTNGYNFRSADGSPFGNNWNGTTTAGTLSFNLTGTFTAGAWSINGGSVKFSDAGFQCQQGGFGGDGRGTLCTQSTVGGGFAADGGALSWGWDVDGSATGALTTSAVDVKDAGGASILSTLSGVLASLSLDGGGNITTNSGEFRRALGSAGGGCINHIRFDGTKISCGTLTTGLLSMSGVATEVVPIPAAAWLAGSALGLLGVMRRRTAKAA